MDPPLSTEHYVGFYRDTNFTPQAASPTWRPSEHSKLHQAPVSLSQNDAPHLFMTTWPVDADSMRAGIHPEVMVELV